MQRTACRQNCHGSEMPASHTCADRPTTHTFSLWGDGRARRCRNAAPPAARRPCCRGMMGHASRGARPPEAACSWLPAGSPPHSRWGITVHRANSACRTSWVRVDSQAMRCAVRSHRSWGCRRLTCLRWGHGMLLPAALPGHSRWGSALYTTGRPGSTQRVPLRHEDHSTPQLAGAALRTDVRGQLLCSYFRFPQIWHASALAMQDEPELQLRLLSNRPRGSWSWHPNPFTIPDSCQVSCRVDMHLHITPAQLPGRGTPQALLGEGGDLCQMPQPAQAGCTAPPCTWQYCCTCASRLPQPHP